MHNRIRLLAFSIIVLFLLVIVRLFNVQVVNSAKFKDQGVGQYVGGKKELEPRGSIYFTRRDGTLISAATMNSGYVLAISPKNITDPESTYNQINEIYKIEKAIFDEKIKKTNDPYEEIAHRLDKKTADLLRGKKIKGVIIARESWRAYPAGKNAAHVLGLVANVDGYEKGVYGLEKYYEKYLVSDSSYSNVNPFAAVFRNLSKSEESRLDIVTTLEPEIQVALEKTLTDIQTSYSSEGVGGIVINPKTGEILAMAYTPSFDPNDPGSAQNESVFLNPAVSRIYEFGSVIKPLIIAAGFDKGLITPDTKYMDTGSIKVGVETINNFDKKGRGLVDIRKILGQSLNTGMVMVAQKLGQSSMRQYLELYGLRSKTGIDLPAETGSLTKNLDSNREIEFASASFGQGFAVTPIQAVRAFSSLGNGGVPVNPYVVKEIRTPDGKIIKSFSPTYMDRAISQEASESISEVLTHIVDNELKAGALAFPHHSVAAKTGTAQMVAPNGRYYDDRYLHSMFAYVPATNPEYLVFLYNLYPKNVDYASASLANPLFSYLRFLISYGTIKPDR